MLETATEEMTQEAVGFFRFLYKYCSILQNVRDITKYFHYYSAVFTLYYLGKKCNFSKMGCPKMLKLPSDNVITYLYYIILGDHGTWGLSSNFGATHFLDFIRSN